jgi:hypothetical protein
MTCGWCRLLVLVVDGHCYSEIQGWLKTGPGGESTLRWFLEVADGTTMYRDEKETKSALYLYDPGGHRIVCQWHRTVAQAGTRGLDECALGIVRGQVRPILNFPSPLVPWHKQEPEDWTSVRWALLGVRLDLF